MATVATARPSPKEGTQTRVTRSSLVAEAGFSRPELLDLARSRSFRTGRFTLSSGKESDVYFNMKLTMMHPRGAELTARAFLQLARDLGVDYVSGLEMGAVPVIGSMAAIASIDAIPIRMTFVRKEAKQHGTQDVIEGLGPAESLAGKKVLVVDDVATSGGSILQAIEEIRRAGGLVEHAACLLDREEGAAENLAAHGVHLHAVLTGSEFVGRD